MATELKFAVLFQAIDAMSDKLGAIGSSVRKMADQITAGGERMRRAGDRMTEWGEKVGIVTAIASEGASRLHEWSDAISEPAMAMERSMATMRAMTGLGGDALDKIKEHAIAFSGTHAGVTAEQWADSFTRLRNVYQDTTKAIAATDAGAMLSRLGVDANGVTRLFSVAASSLGTSAPEVADQLVAVSKAYSIDPGEDISRLVMAYGRLGGLAKSTHTTGAELMSLLGESDKAFGGGRGIGTFAGMINEMVSSGKSGDIWSHGLLEGFRQIKSSIAGLSPEEQLAAVKQMGAGGNASQLITLLNNLDEVGDKTTLVLHAAGANQKAFSQATANASDETKLLHQNISNLYDAMYSPALPTINGWLKDFIGIAQGATSATAHHATAARRLSIAITGVGGAAYYGLSGMSALGTSFIFAGQGVKALGWLFGESGKLNFGVFRAAGSAIARLGDLSGLASVGTKLWAGAQWLLNVALGVGVMPILAIVAAAALLAVTAYEIYEHWAAITGLFDRIWKRIAGIDWKGLGLGILKSIASGLWDGIKFLASPLTSATGFIMKHFPRSPAELGPLRQISHIRIIESIADTMRPAPIIRAANRVARFAMVAAPSIAIGAAAPAFARPSPGAPGRADRAAVVLNYAPVIHVGAGASKDDIVAALKPHAREIEKILEHYRATRDRRNYHE